MTFKVALCGGALLAAFQVAAASQTVPAPGAEKTSQVLQSSPELAELSKYLSGKQVSISDVVRLTLVANRSLAHAKAAYLISEGRVAEANSALFPTLSSALAELRLDSAVSSTHLTNADPSSFASPIGEKVEDQRIQQRIYSIGASIPIDISGEIRAVIDQAKYYRLASKLDLSRLVNDQVASVKSAFYDVLRARALRKVAEDDLAAARLRLKDAQSRYAAQVVTKFDVLRAETDAAHAEQVLISARNRVESFYSLLNTAIGIRGDIRLHATEEGAVTVPETTTPGPDTTFSLDSQSVKTLIHQAVSVRPEVLEAEVDIRAAQTGLKIASRSARPSLSLGYGYVYAPDAGGVNPIYHQWVASAIVTVPLYDAGLAKARDQEARGLLDSAKVSRRDAEDQVTQDVQQALIAVSDAVDRVRVSTLSLKEATDAYHLASLRYTEGVSSHAGISPLLELTDAQAALTGAESDQVNALYDYNNAKSVLAHAMGEYTKSN